MLPDFNEHGVAWLIDSEAKSIRRVLNGGSSVEGKGFAKQFTVGGPLAVFETAGGSYLLWRKEVVSLEDKDLHIEARWNPLWSQVTIHHGSAVKRFLDVTIGDAISRVTDVTWGERDEELRDIAAAILNWQEHAQQARRRRALQERSSTAG